MARIRAIKPDFFKNEALAELSFAHRLLFAGLWTQADRAGILEDRPRRLKAELFPYDQVDIDQMLCDLARGTDPLIERYEGSDGYRYIFVRKFAEHQRPHKTEQPSVYPLPNQEVVPQRFLSVVAPVDNRSETLGREGKGNDQEGKEESASEPVASLPKPRPSSPDDLADAWNELKAESLPRCVELTDKRKRHAQVRLRERSLDEWREVIRRISVSDFCLGVNDRGWVASFDFLLQADTAAKVLEGKYDNRPRGNIPRNRAPARREDDDWFEVCERLHGGNCGGRSKHALRMDTDALKAAQ